MLDNLVSKVIAAGLAAGVFLLWWPAHLPSAGVQWLVLRGLAWTLAFEVLVLSFVPLEAMATRALRRRRDGARASRLRRRLATAPPPARASGAVMLAFTGLLLPGLLLLHSGRLPAPKPAAQTTKVVRKVVVRKVVRERTVVVREAAPVAPAAVAAPAPASAQKKDATPKKAATPKPSTTPAASTEAEAKQTTRTPATTTTPTLPDPPAAAAPAASADAGAPADATAAAG
jgi:outer membrane biosynthesis protein TonB